MAFPIDNPKQQFNTRSKSCVPIFIRTGSGALLNEFLLMMRSASSERVAAILRDKIEEHVDKPVLIDKSPGAIRSSCRAHSKTTLGGFLTGFGTINALSRLNPTARTLE